MPAICLHSKDEIAAVLNRSPYLHLYALGDLDDFFWPYTQWYGLEEQGDIREIVLLYTAFETPVFQAITQDPDAMNDLLRSIMPLLPQKIYTHLSSGLPEAFEGIYDAEEHGLYGKMALTRPDHLNTVDTSAVIPLTPADADELKELYSISNPEAWFDPRMLETGCYFGIRASGSIVSVAGIHVYSPTYRAAALGNVVTHPDFRGRGYAQATCARLCQAMQGTIHHIGLNVKSSNVVAIRAYEKLGFTHVGVYGEYMLTLK